ncbi:MAG: hypothetical protein ABSC87_04840 [Halobacteriota archaeon]
MSTEIGVPYIAFLVINKRIQFYAGSRYKDYPEASATGASPLEVTSSQVSDSTSRASSQSF